MTVDQKSMLALVVLILALIADRLHRRSDLRGEMEVKEWTKLY